MTLTQPNISEKYCYHMNVMAIPGFSEPFSSISHLAGAVLFLVLSIKLIMRGRGNAARVASLSIYSFCLVFLFSMSGVYHLLNLGMTARYVFQLLDHAGIYVLIAGSYTPIHVILFRGVHRWGILLLVWTLAITGLTLTSIFFRDMPEWLYLTFYLTLGWIGLFTLWKIYHFHSRALFNYIFVGGLFYTIGALIEFFRWPTPIYGHVGPHEIFHIFVILGAYSHWKLIYTISNFPISKNLFLIVREFPDNNFFGHLTSEKALFKTSSVDEMKTQVKDWVRLEYRAGHHPNAINIRYFKEEDFSVTID